MAQARAPIDLDIGFDDGDDCQASSAAAVMGVYRTDAPSIQDLEAEYARRVPSWPNDPPHWPTFREVVQSFGWTVQVVADWDTAGALLRAGNPLVVWNHRWDARTGRWFLHAECLVLLHAGRAEFWDAQNHRYHSAPIADWLGRRGSVQYAGHLYVFSPVHGRVPTMNLDGIIDQRGKLRTRPDFGSYDWRSTANINGVVLHYTAGPYDHSPRDIADYQTSAAAAPQTGTGKPFPGIAYHLLVDGAGAAHLCWDLDRIVWHAGRANGSTIGICFTGNGAPRSAQLDGIVRAIRWCQTQLGHELAISPHSQHSQTSCPGSYAGYIGSINAKLKGSPAPAPVKVSRQQALDEIWRIAGLVRPGYPGEADTLERMVAVLK